MCLYETTSNIIFQFYEFVRTAVNIFVCVVVRLRILCTLLISRLIGSSADVIMKALRGLVFLVFCLNGLCYAQAKKFAVLVATTKSWYHYGHQATMLHAYQTLIANGFPRANIITMFYDDIAYHNNNPEPGIIRNHPQGENVYENVKKDYTGEKVTANNFEAVLTGNYSAAEGPVIRRNNARDTLFIYLVGFSMRRSGNYGLTFPTGTEISGERLVQILENLTKNKKFKKIYVMADVSSSGEMFRGLSPTSSVFVVASTISIQHPKLVYCYPEKRLCYGSMFGVAWTQYSDRLRQLKLGAKRLVYDQFNHVRYETPYQLVDMYGDLTVGWSYLKEFIGYKYEGKPNRDAHTAFTNEIKLGLAKSDFQSPLSNSTKLEDSISWDGRQNSNYDRSLNAEDSTLVAQKRKFIKKIKKNMHDRLRLAVASNYKNIPTIPRNDQCAPFTLGYEIP